MFNFKYYNDEALTLIIPVSYLYTNIPKIILFCFFGRSILEEVDCL